MNNKFEYQHEDFGKLHIEVDSDGRIESVELQNEGEVCDFLDIYNYLPDAFIDYLQEISGDYL